MKAITGALDRIKDNVRISLSVHSHGKNLSKIFTSSLIFLRSGNLWLTPWGYKKQLPLDDDKMMKLANAAKERLEAVNGRKYKAGAAGAIFYPAGK